MSAQTLERIETPESASGTAPTSASRPDADRWVVSSPTFATSSHDLSDGRGLLLIGALLFALVLTGPMFGSSATNMTTGSSSSLQIVVSG